MTTPARDQLARYRRDPVAFCREVLGFEPWSKQREILESVRDYTRTAVRSCHGPGKTAVAARCALWFLSVFEHSKVITTAPTFQQVRELLWAEIHVAYRDAGGFVGGQLSDTRLELAPDWVALGLSTDQPERFQGHHAEHLLLVVDEASGVAEEIYEAAAGFLTSPGARCLLIGNPTRTSGEFFNAFHSARGFYNTIAIPASSTPAFTGEPVPEHVRRRLVSTQWVEEHTRKWGDGSPLYQIRIAAEFPSREDDAVVALRDLEDAHARTLEPDGSLVIGCDVARYGSDLTVLALRHGSVVRIARSYGGSDLMRTVGEITRLARDLEATHGSKPTIVVDDVGVGGGVTDRLRELQRQNELAGCKIVAYSAARAAAHPNDYPNRRSEDWFKLAELLPQLDLDPDPELAADLLAPRYTIDSHGRRVVEPKAETKKRLRRSPDRADAVMMTLTINPPGGRKVNASIHVPPARTDTSLGLGRGRSYAERRLDAYRQQQRHAQQTHDHLTGSGLLGLPPPELGIHFGDHLDHE